MRNIAICLCFISALGFNVNAQTECDVNRMMMCGQFLANIGSSTALLEQCRFYEEYKACVLGVVGCDGANTIAQSEAQLAQAGIDMKLLCPVVVASTRGPEDGTKFPSQCNIVDIYNCGHILAQEVQQARGDDEKVCQAATKYVTCLNKLTSCINDPAFTQARQTLEEMNLKDICAQAIAYPSSSPSFHGNTIASIISMSLLFCFWMLKRN
ncbi:uncharacterized protein LOC124137195 [Haliotis rufescens]|uniref:uncharacterized protein LOC124137195 n=1 Tax=Haliotis rufescens TaxID=6454 RepID=UPI00201EA5ED|nr:uncharacterized protein LOC124137195 [Haliotis rufescens]